jgi:hypothetical protein
MWAWAGLGPLHQQRILAAYSTEKGAWSPRHLL